MFKIELLAKVVQESWRMAGQMGPFLLFGFLAAGILSVFISAAWIEKRLSGPGLGPSFKAALFGVPLPLCSCSVIPVAASLRRHGANRGATAAFLLSTPQTGVDSIAVTYALLGPVFAIFRPLAALLTGLIGGLLVQSFGKRAALANSQKSTPSQEEVPACHDACCSENGMGGALKRALRYGLLDLPRDIGLALMIGIVVAGALTALIKPDELGAYLGAGVGSILLLMAAGTPLYVCATASVPIAAGFLHLGASPGAALAFLIAGPATNAATFTTVWKMLGRRSAAIYLLVVAVSAVGGGLLLNEIAELWGDGVPLLGEAAHEHESEGLMAHFWATALFLLLIVSYIWPLLAGRKDKEQAQDDKNIVAQERLELRIEGMTCGHCAETVRLALAECAGVASVEVSIKPGLAVILGGNRGEGLDPQRLHSIIAELGYRSFDQQ